MIARLFGMIAAVALLSTALTAAAMPVASGNLDPSFGHGGEVVLQPGASCVNGCGGVEFFGPRAQALALAPDGAVVLAGNVDPSGDAWLARLNAHGALDPTFGSGGYAESAPRLYITRAFVDASGDTLVLVDGPGGLGLERYTAAGLLDGSFGPQGLRWLTLPLSSHDEALDTEGRIVILGQTARGEIAVARFLASGARDPRFGRGGVSYLPVMANAEPAAVEPDSHGGIIVVGVTPIRGQPHTSARLSIARLTPAGRLDRSFGGKGVVHVSWAFSGYADAVAVGPHREVLLARGGRHSRLARELMVARYTSSGVLDQSFGRHGIARTAIPAGARMGLAVHAIAFDAEGDAIVAGGLHGHAVDTIFGRWLLARYTSHGRDCSFGVHGTVEGGSGEANAVAVQRDGRIVIAGWSPPIREGQPRGAGTAVMAARYIGGGHPRTCVGEGR